MHTATGSQYDIDVEREPRLSEANVKMKLARLFPPQLVFLASWESAELCSIFFHEGKLRKSVKRSRFPFTEIAQSFVRSHGSLVFRIQQHILPLALLFRLGCLAFFHISRKPPQQFSKIIYKVNNIERIAPAWITWILIMNQFVILVIY